MKTSYRKLQDVNHLVRLVQKSELLLKHGKDPKLITFLQFHLCLSHLIQLLLFTLHSSILFCGGGNISFIFYYFCFA